MGMAAIKLSNTLIIVIAVSGLVCCALILFLIFRCCRRPKSAPLPPIQPLAHHREKEPNNLLHPHFPRNGVGLGQLGRYESDTSLLKPSRKPSFQTEESHGTPSSSHHSSSVSPLPTNVTYQSGPPLVGSHPDEPAAITQQYMSTTRLTRSASRTRLKPPQPRATSSVSTHSISTHAPTRSPNTIHGAPHSSLSNVQIVLPTPLAPQLQNHIVTNSTFGSYEDLVGREGIADGWTTAPNRSTSLRSRSRQDLLIQGTSRGRKTSSSAAHRFNRSSDTTDRRGRTELHTQLRGQGFSSRSAQLPPLSHADIAPSSWSMDNQTQSSGAISKEPRYGQAGQPPSRELSRSSSRVKTDSRSRSRSTSRFHLSPNNTPNLPFPQSLPHSSYHHTPSFSADTLTHHLTYNGPSSPPMPALPQLSQNSFQQTEHVPSRQFASSIEPEDSGGTSSQAINKSTSNAIEPIIQKT